MGLGSFAKKRKKIKEKNEKGMELSGNV